MRPRGRVLFVCLLCAVAFLGGVLRCAPIRVLSKRTASVEQTISAAATEAAFVDAGGIFSRVPNVRDARPSDDDPAPSLRAVLASTDREGRAVRSSRDRSVGGAPHDDGLRAARARAERMVFLN